MTLRVSTNRYF